MQGIIQRYQGDFTEIKFNVILNPRCACKPVRFVNILSQKIIILRLMRNLKKRALIFGILLIFAMPVMTRFFDYDL
jgi:hypothetical protein